MPAAPPRGARWSGAVEPLLTLAFGAAFAGVALGAGGGLQLQPVTVVEMILEIVSGVLCAAALLIGHGARRPWGGVTLALFAAFAILTGVSIIWAIDPSAAWIEANRTITAVGVLASGIALVRMVPRHWRSLIGGVLVASLIVSGYALLTKVFPAWLASGETYGRLREPFEYWNAVGLMAALGLPPAIWLGARRDGHAGLAALAYPATGVLILTILMAYSRGALLAAGVGIGLWLIVAPLRLRSATVLLPSLFLGGIAAWWTFGQEGLSKDQIPLAIRSNAGTELGVLVGVLVLLLLLTGFLASWLRDRRAWSQNTRRTWGVVLIVGLALVPVALAAGARDDGPRPRREHLARLALADGPEREHPEQRPEPADRDRQRARAVLARRHLDLQGAPGRRRRRGRLPGRAAALPQGRPRRAARARVSRADGGEPRPRGPRADAGAAGGMARRRDPDHGTVARPRRAR